MTRSPWARFISLMTPKTIERPNAMRAYNPPSRMPITRGVIMSPEPIIFLLHSTYFYTEISLLYPIFLTELCRGAAQRYAPGFEDIRPVRLFKRSPYVLFHKKNGDASLFDLFQCLEKLINHDWSETERHLVDQHQLRVGH